MIYVVGIDPGPTTGIAGLWIVGGELLRLDVVQCNDGALMRVLKGLWLEGPGRIVAERFVVGPRAGRSRTPKAGQVARAQLTLVAEWARTHGVPYDERTAVQVKAWAGHARMDAAGLLVPTTSMNHARDAARHALFHAVEVQLLPDPLSKRGVA